MNKIPLFKVHMSPTASMSVKAVLESGMIGEGPKTKLFNIALQKLLHSKYITCTNSCTSALTISLKLSNINPGDVVIISPFTMIATACAVSTLNGKVKYSKICPKTLCMDLKSGLESALKHKAKAIIVTLVTGNIPLGLEAFLNKCKENNIKVVFDAAHALLTYFKGKHISSFPDFCCFSFQAIKHLTTGDGGALVCKSSEDSIRAEKLKWFGMSRIIPKGITRLEHQTKFSVQEAGYKMQMNDIAASIGLANINIAKNDIDLSRVNSTFYSKNLPKENLVTVPKNCISSCWTYPFLVHKKRIKSIVTGLSSIGIETCPMWKEVNLHDAFSDSISPWLSNHRPIFIPNGFWVGRTEREIIIENVLKAIKD